MQTWFERVISGNWHCAISNFCLWAVFRQGFQDEAYFPYTVLHISVLSVFFFFLGLKNEIWNIPRLKNEVSFKSFALEMGCLIVQDFKNEAYIPYTVLHIFVLSAFFFLRLEKRYFKFSAPEERGIFQVIRVWYGLFRSMALKKRGIFSYVPRLLHLLK